MKFKDEKLLGIDFGTKFTGVATYYVGHDPFPLPFGRIPYKNEDQVIAEIQKICDQELVTMIIIGIPLFTDGNESTWTKTVKAFKLKLEQKIPLTIFEQDETLSTFEAEDRMKNSPRYNFKVDLNAIDALCASIILEDFISQSK